MGDAGASTRLITQRSLVQIQPPQPSTNPRDHDDLGGFRFRPIEPTIQHQSSKSRANTLRRDRLQRRGSPRLTSQLVRSRPGGGSRSTERRDGVRSVRLRDADGPLTLPHESVPSESPDAARVRSVRDLLARCPSPKPHPLTPGASNHASPSKIRSAEPDWTWRDGATGIRPIARASRLPPVTPHPQSATGAGKRNWRGSSGSVAEKTAVVDYAARRT